MTKTEKMELIDGFNVTSFDLNTEDENIPNYVYAILALLEAACREGFAIVLQPVEMSTGWRWIEAKEIKDGDRKDSSE